MSGLRISYRFPCHRSEGKIKLIPTRPACGRAQRNGSETGVFLRRQDLHAGSGAVDQRPFQRGNPIRHVRRQDSVGDDLRDTHGRETAFERTNDVPAQVLLDTENYDATTE